MFQMSRVWTFSSWLSKHEGPNPQEIEEINYLALELVKEEGEEEDTATVLAPGIREMLVLQRILHAKKGLKEESQREHIFHSRWTIQGV